MRELGRVLVNEISLWRKPQQTKEKIRIACIEQNKEKTNYDREINDEQMHTSKWKFSGDCGSGVLVSHETFTTV